jgi:hypothetical protein
MTGFRIAVIYFFVVRQQRILGLKNDVSAAGMPGRLTIMQLGNRRIRYSTFCSSKVLLPDLVDLKFIE